MQPSFQTDGGSNCLFRKQRMHRSQKKKKNCFSFTRSHMYGNRGKVRSQSEINMFSLRCRGPGGGRIHPGEGIRSAGTELSMVLKTVLQLTSQIP